MIFAHITGAIAETELPAIEQAVRNTVPQATAITSTLDEDGATVTVELVKDDRIVRLNIRKALKPYGNVSIQTVN